MLTREREHLFNSATIGIPTASPDGYYLKLPYSVRITNSGTFLHAQPGTVRHQGVRNVSHGCINLSTANARWFYETEQARRRGPGGQRGRRPASDRRRNGRLELHLGAVAGRQPRRLGPTRHDGGVIPCHPTRRQALSWAAVVAATPLLSAAVDPERAYGAPLVALPMDLELVTLTETSVVLTWYTGDPTSLDGLGRLSPAPADTEVLMGTNPANLKQVHYSSTPTPYHYAEIHGLEPGQTYFYVAQSGGIPAAPAKSFTGNVVGTTGPSTLQGLPFVFTTPQPPAGTYLFSLVLCNDLHFGETTAGLITSEAGGLPPGLPAGARPSAVPGGDVAGTDDRHQGAGRRLPAGCRRPDGGGEAGRRGACEGGAEPVRRAGPRLVRRARQPRPPAQRQRLQGLQQGTVRRQARLLQGRVLPG